MKEITEITTIELTNITVHKDKEAEEILESKAEAEENCKRLFEDFFETDDVNVRIQYFVRDLNEGRTKKLLRKAKNLIKRK